jgi:hypothetical protein
VPLTPVNDAFTVLESFTVVNDTAEEFLVEVIDTALLLSTTPPKRSKTYYGMRDLNPNHISRDSLTRFFYLWYFHQTSAPGQCLCPKAFSQMIHLGGYIQIRN